MIAGSVQRRQSLLATALAKAQSFLFEADEELLPVAPPAPRRRPVVAVVGIAPGCGATTVARALAAQLAERDEQATAAVTAILPRGGLQIASSAALRLTRDLVVTASVPARAAGRLCFAAYADLTALAHATRHRAPLVIDVPHGEPATAAASLADHVVVVASPAAEPSLAAAVRDSLARAGPTPVVVLNRATDTTGGYALPDSAFGARVAMSGRAPGGPLGAAIAELAERCGSAE